MRTLTTADTLAVLKMLASGRSLDFTAAANPHLSDEQVREVAQSHGYPNVANVRKAVAIIEDRQVKDEVASLPSAQPRPQTVRPRIASTPAAVLTPVPTITADATARLLEQAAASPKARIRALGKKASEDIARVRDALAQVAAAEKAKEAARSRRQAEKRARERAREQVRAEVKRLEDELRAARAKLRGNRASSTVAAMSAGEPTESARIRAWCAETGVEVNANGRIPASVREAYEAAQSERAS